MIQKLQIRNFRTHKKLDIDFSPLVNSIIGRNATGKSTIIRAIRWVVRNKPAGDSIINWDANKAAVRLTIDENKITRIKGKGVNIYKLRKKGWKKDKVFKALKKNKVPADIEKVVNLSDINFQGQHEAPFWFCEKASEVSRQLNTIINLEVIDTTLSNIDSALRKSRITITITRDRLNKATKQQKALIYIEQIDKDLEGVESLQKQHQEKAAGCVLLRDILKSVRLYQYEREIASNLICDSKLALSKGILYQRITVQIENLSKSVKSGINLQKIIDTKPPSLDYLEKLRKLKDVLFNQHLLFKRLIKEIYIYKEKKCQAEMRLKECKKEYNEVVGNRCPLCGRKQTEKS